jgi:hypothetical protein
MNTRKPDFPDINQAPDFFADGNEDWCCPCGVLSLGGQPKSLHVLATITVCPGCHRKVERTWA